MATNFLIDGNVVDQVGAPVVGASVYIYDLNGLVEVFDEIGQAIKQPIATGEDGYWSAYVPDQRLYTIKYYWGGRLRLTDANRYVGSIPLAVESSAAARDAATESKAARDTALAYRNEAQEVLSSTQDAKDIAIDARNDALAAIAGGVADFYPGARSNVPQGATGHGAITGGSSGTDGTFALAFSGGNFAVNPTGTFTVSGGAVTAITITGPGLYIGGAISAPTLSFAASSGLSGASAALTTGFLVASGEYYYTDHASDASQVARFQNVSGTATEVDASVDWLNIARAEAAVAGAEALFTNPFPADKYDIPRLTMVNDVSVATTAEYLADRISIDNGQRLLIDQLLSKTDLAVGNTIRVAFKLLAGSATPPSFVFRSSSAAVGSAIAFAQVGEYFVANATWPSGADRFRIDWTNSSGVDTDITRPAFAKFSDSASAAVASRTRFNSLLATSSALSNDYGGATGISGTSGAGTGTPVVNADGSVFAPANRLFTILAPNLGGDFPPKPVGSPVTLILKSTSARHNAVNAFFVGSATGTISVVMRQMENGYWLWQGNIPAISGSTAAHAVWFQIDNRDNGNANYSAIDATISDFMVIDGLEIPDRILAPGATTSGVSDEAAISWTKTGTAPNRQVSVFARNASGDKVHRYRFDEKVDAARSLDSLGWAKWDVGNYVAGVWTSERELFAVSEVSTAIQTQQAIDEPTGDEFIWGGGTHGQQVFTSLQFLIDGTAYDLGDLPDSGSATGDKFTIIGSGYAYDENTTTTALTGQTQYDIAHGELRKFDTIRYEKSESVGPCYLAMAPVITADVEEIFVNGTGQKIGAVATAITSGNQRRPSIVWQGDLGTVVMDAVNHDGEIGVLVDNRSTFWKGYFAMNGSHTGKVSKVAGDRQYLLTSYRHYS